MDLRSTRATPRLEVYICLISSVFFQMEFEERGASVAISFMSESSDRRIQTFKCKRVLELPMTFFLKSVGLKKQKELGE